MEISIESQNQRWREVELAIENGDLNRTSRRLLDLVYEFELPQFIKQRALDLRKLYNLQKELGSSGNSDENLTKSFQELLKEIQNHKRLFSVESALPEIICRAEKIGKQYGAGFKLEPIDLVLERGKIIGLVGENGNGKTTLLRVLCGELYSETGKLTFFEGGQSIDTWEEVKQEIAFIPQRIPRWFGTVEEQISFCAAAKGIHGEKNLEQTAFIIHRLGLTKFMHHTWGMLSSGYKLRVEIARTLVWQPRVLILDEPLANLDLLAQELLLQDLRDLASSFKQPVSMILSSQQLHEVETIADQIVFLKNGRAVFNGALNELKDQEDFHTLELDGNFGYNELAELLQPFQPQLEKTASGYTIRINKANSIREILGVINNTFELKYFRDITNSTKKLFNDQY